MAEACFLTLVLLLVNGIEGQSLSRHCFDDVPSCMQAREAMLGSWTHYEPQLVVLRAGECRPPQIGFADRHPG